MVVIRTSEPFEFDSVADRFWFFAHGAPRLHERALNFGLGACLIGDLVLGGWAQITPNPDPFNRDALLTGMDNRPVAPSGDLDKRSAAASAALPWLWREMVQGDPWRHPIPTALRFAATAGPEQVVARLTTGGHLKKQGRHLVSVDGNTDGLPAARVWAVLNGRREADYSDYLLLAVADAAGLGEYLIAGELKARNYFEWFRRSLPLPDGRPDFAELARHTAAAVAGGVLIRGTV